MPSSFICRVPRRSPSRQGAVFLDCAVVGTFAVILAAVMTTCLSQNRIEELGLDGDARRLAVDLFQAKQASPQYLQPYFFLFSPSDEPTRYALYREKGDRGELELQLTRQIPAGTNVLLSSPTLSFDPRGVPRARYTVEFRQSAQWQRVTVETVTGAVRLETLGR